MHSAKVIGWTRDVGLLDWSRSGLIELQILAGPIQHFQTAFLDAWGAKVAEDLCRGKVLEEGRYWIFLLLSNSLSHPMLGNETEEYSEAFFLVMYGMDFYSDRPEEVSFHAVIVVDLMVMVTCFWIVLSAICVSSSPPEFTSLISRDKTHWPRCLLWHGWLLSLSCNMMDSP